MAQAMYNSEYSPNISYLGSRVRWGAVMAGVVAGMITQVILSLLGLAIGFNVLDPANPDARALGIGGGAWLFVSAILSGFVGGWVASALANISLRLDGLMHGVLSWGVFMVIAALLLGTSLGTMIGGAFNLTSSALTSPQMRTQGVAAVREQVGNLTNQMQAERSQQQAGQGEATRSEQAADVAAGATWATFFVAVLSLAASAVGGVVGLRRPDARVAV